MANASNSANLLSPNAAFGEQANGQNQNLSPQSQQRRKSTLSNHGFFIDYSNTRRRSSTAARDHQYILARNNQILRSYVSPSRWARGEAGPNGTDQSQPTASGHQVAHCPLPGRLQSRASCSAASGFGLRAAQSGVLQSGGANNLLLPQLHVQAALAGSRKTSIFDPTGHSVAPHIIARRKSTMVSSPGCPRSGILTAAVGAARSGRQGRGKGELAQHVPVIGCSPTSIQASLAALDETRRYEKLMKRVQRHQRRKEKRRRRRQKEHQARLKSCLSGDSRDEDIDTRRVGEGGANEEDAEHQWRPTPSLRRKSLRAIQNAADLLSGNYGHNRGHSHNDTMDGLSMSTMSFISSHSSGSSCQSMAWDQSELEQEEGDCDHLEAEEVDREEEEQSQDTCTSDNEQSPRRFVGRNTNDRVIESSLTKNRDLPGGQNWQTEPKEAPKSRSLVKLAMKKIAATINSSTNLTSNKPTTETPNKSSVGHLNVKANQNKHKPDKPKQGQTPTRETRKHLSNQKPKRKATRRSISGDINYWYYYYYYMRENSFDTTIEDLPIRVGATDPPMTDAERRARLYINYSLARIEILNSSTDPIERLAKKLAQVDDEANDFTRQICSNSSQSVNRPNGAYQTLASGVAGQKANVNGVLQYSNSSSFSPISNLFDFSQSTDVSLTLSTSSSLTTMGNSISASSSISIDSSDWLDSDPLADNGCLKDAHNCSPYDAPSQEQTFATTDIYNAFRDPNQNHSSNCAPVRTSKSMATSPMSGQHNQRAAGGSLFPKTRKPDTDDQQMADRCVEGPFKTECFERDSSSGRDSRKKCSTREETNSRIQVNRNYAHQVKFPNGKDNNDNSGQTSGTPAARATTRHSHINLALEFDSLDLNSPNGTRRSASFADTTNFGQSANDNEEELDDFERLNRCYKPQLQHQQNQQQQLSSQSYAASSGQTTPIQQRSSLDLNKATGGSASSTRLANGRNSNFRLSVRSTREFERQSFGPKERKVSRNTRNASQSWDTLALVSAPRGSGDKSGANMRLAESNVTKAQLVANNSSKSQRDFVACDSGDNESIVWNESATFHLQSPSSSGARYQKTIKNLQVTGYSQSDNIPRSPNSATYASEFIYQTSQIQSPRQGNFNDQDINNGNRISEAGNQTSGYNLGSSGLNNIRNQKDHFASGSLDYVACQGNLKMYDKFKNSATPQYSAGAGGGVVAPVLMPEQLLQKPRVASSSSSSLSPSSSCYSASHRVEQQQQHQYHRQQGCGSDCLPLAVDSRVKARSHTCVVGLDSYQHNSECLNGRQEKSGRSRRTSASVRLRRKRRSIGSGHRVGGSRLSSPNLSCAKFNLDGNVDISVRVNSEDVYESPPNSLNNSAKGEL